MSISKARLPTQKEKGFPSFPHSSKENDCGGTWTLQSENKATKEQALLQTRQELHGFIQHTKDVKTCPHCWRLIFPPGTGNMHSEMSSVRHGKPSESPVTAIAAPWTRHKSSSNWKLLACTKEREESQCSHGHPEKKGPQFSYVPTGKDALMLSKNYSLQVVCAPGINKTHHQWGGLGQRKYW